MESADGAKGVTRWLSLFTLALKSPRSGNQSNCKMETSKMDQISEARSKLKVVKVVKLKQFMPNTDTGPVFKRKIFNNFNDYLPNTHTKDVDIKNKILSDSMLNIENKLNAHEIETSSNIDNSNSHKTKLPDKRKCKIKFRSCSHTPEELSKLTEHGDESLVKVGDMFESRDAFRRYINDNAKRWFYYYVCRTSKKNVLEYNCICMAYTHKPKVVIIRRQKKRTTACPCKIRLTVDEETKKFIVYYVCNHHDHVLTETEFYHYPHAKYLPQEVKDVFLDLAYLGLDMALIQKYIHSLVGLTIKRKDISSYAYKFKRKSFQRNLTAERRKYIKDLIATIRDTYKETVDVTLERISEDDCQIKQSNRKKIQGNSKEGQNKCTGSTIDADININYSEPEDYILANVLDSDADLNNCDVIVQYINEEGILCDQNGTPVTNSSAIMQFIDNYECVVPENKDAVEFLEEGMVFSELVENISDDVYSLDWEAKDETKPLIEKLDGVNDNTSPVETTEDVVVDATNVKIEEAETDERQLLGQTSRITILSDVVVNCDKRSSPTSKSPAAYAEMDNFKKYYFVDHRYIKYDGENSNNQTQIAIKESQIKRRERIAKCAIARGEEYLKAPEFIDRVHTPLRQCLGHERLALLSDPDVILPGAKFLTHAVFLKYINERANRWFFYYSIVESGKTPEYYVYKCVFGKHRSSRNAYRAKGLRRRAKLTTQCPCQIRLRRLYSQPDYLTVLYSCNHHDHALDAQLFKTQPHSRRLPDHIKEEIKDFLSLGAKFDVLRKYVVSETGLPIYGKYFHNVRVKMAKDGESRQFTEERFAALTQKLKDLEAAYGSASSENPHFETSQEQAAKCRPSFSKIQTEDQYQCIEVDFDEATTKTQEYYQLAKKYQIAEEVCIVQLAKAMKQTTDSSQRPATRKHSRLATRLKNLSSHEETLLKVKKLQDSVRSDNLRNCCEVTG